MRREWIAGMLLLGLALTALLALAWNDAGIEPVGPLSAPAIVPEAGR